MSRKTRFVLAIVLSASTLFTSAQSILPPENAWKGKSELLIAKPGSAWLTYTEKSGFTTTPNYKETMSWFRKLVAASPLMHMISIGKSPEGRDINMVIASTEKNISAAALKKSGKPILLVQSGIHSGEIDGKDAGMMLLRDIAFGNKKSLLNGVNLIFIPILNVDGHERSSPYNRPNQRGPSNMGWRTNAQNLNLNRDYAKLDTKEVRSVVAVMNEYDPLFYMDIHVTDGADYQYDITFGGLDKQGYSPGIEHWLEATFKATADKELIANGHIPGQLIFSVNDRDFSDGTILTLGEPRFSNAYGDLRHMASVLVENHSLKPYKQRVLGTYVLLESTMKILAAEGQSLWAVTQTDKTKTVAEIPLRWKVPQMKNSATFETQSGVQRDSSAPAPDSLNFLAISSVIHRSDVTGANYVEWLGKPTDMRIANYKGTQPIDFVSRPKAYWVPAANYEIIARLKMHGIKMEIIKAPREVSVEMYRIRDAKFQDASGKAQPFEGHIQVEATAVTEIRKEVFAPGSAIIETDQPLGDLAMMLLEPNSPDSYFSWGFFYPIFQRTEYIEAYVMEPTMKKMLNESPDLKTAFEQKKASDSSFVKNPDLILTWFYSKTKYYDGRYLLYPVGREMKSK